MTQKEYRVYLGNLINEEVNPETEEFYAYFQCFMPNGKDVEKVFDPILNGSIYYERLKPIYGVTENSVEESISEESSPAYFVPQETPIENKILIQLGEKILKNYTIFARFLNEPELIGKLQLINQVKISNNSEQDYNNETQSLFYEIFSDWTIDKADPENLLNVLDEAYYSIASDYFLSAYFQYPKFKNKPEIDVFRPYFNLWQVGYKCVLNDDSLIIFS